MKDIDGTNNLNTTDTVADIDKSGKYIIQTANKLQIDQPNTSSRRR